MNDIATVHILANDLPVIVDVRSESFDRAGEINLGEITYSIPRVAVEAVGRGVRNVASYNLPGIVNPAGDGLGGAGEIDLSENVAAEQEAVAEASNGIPVASHNLAPIIDPPAACVEGVRDLLDIDVKGGKDARRENEAVKACEAEAVAELSYDHTWCVDIDGSRFPVEEGARDIDRCEPAGGITQITMFDVIAEIGVVSHDQAVNIYSIALCLDRGERRGKRDVKGGEDKATSQGHWNET